MMAGVSSATPLVAPDAFVDAQTTFLAFIRDPRIEDIEHGNPATNSVAVERLSPRDRLRGRTQVGQVS
jgi:hypothetical protein